MQGLTWGCEHTVPYAMRGVTQDRFGCSAASCTDLTFSSIKAVKHVCCHGARGSPLHGTARYFAPNLVLSQPVLKSLRACRRQVPLLAMRSRRSGPGIRSRCQGRPSTWRLQRLKVWLGLIDGSNSKQESWGLRR